MKTAYSLFQQSTSHLCALLASLLLSPFLFANNFITNASDVITIPVVVHVLYNNAGENISDAQIHSQLDVLNNDFRGRNADRNKVPAYFADLAADAGFEFKLARTDMKGYATNGIVRKHTTIQMFGTDDRIKSSSRGGDDAWDRNQYLNIWIGNLAGGILGYTSSYGGPAEKDGVVIHYTAFGTLGTVSAPFNLGRTATHEIGHWLNLIHIWGDTYCGDDQVNDTPKQRSANRGTPTGEKFSCEAGGHGDMYMNFMDLSNDASMFMFTKGQRERMRSAFSTAGSRRHLLASNALNVSTLTAPRELPASSTEQPANFSVYPNPASAQITLDIKGDVASAGDFIRVYNYLGHPLIAKAITGTKLTIDVSGLANGVYLLKTGKGDLAKFVKN